MHLRYQRNNVFHHGFQDGERGKCAQLRTPLSPIPYPTFRIVENLPPDLYKCLWTAVDAGVVDMLLMLRDVLA